MAIIFTDSLGRPLSCAELDNNFREVLNRGNHTGTQLASTISDLEIAVEQLDLIQSLSNCCTTLTNEINQLKFDLFEDGTLATIIADLEAQLDQIISDLDTFLEVSPIIQGLETDISDLQTRVTDLETTADGLTSAIAANTSAINTKASITSVNDLTAVVNTKAPINNPTFTGTVTAPTPSLGANPNTVATVGYVSNFSLPIGIYLPYTGTVPPNGDWVFANGQELSRTGYSEYFALVGTSYGIGDGVNTFNVINLSGRVTVGAGLGFALRQTGGEETVTLTTNQMPRHNHPTNPHTHDVIDPGHIHNSDNGRNGGPGGPGEGKPNGSRTNPTTSSITNISIENATVTTQEVGNSQPHNNMQPYIVSNFILKVR